MRGKEKLLNLLVEGNLVEQCLFQIEGGVIRIGVIEEGDEREELLIEQVESLQFGLSHAIRDGV